ncbi:MAG: FAD-dependent oxidoreductase, partial [Lachnospiraceae bacterium]|nr:FAD-dependent oxidoreductase [Lachnospiraceae bacterium]
MECRYTKKYDVAIVGAGVAGIAAALAAARLGCRTALIEKQTLIGGLATSGLIYVYLPLCDGNGHQVTFGIAEELMKESLKYSPCDFHPDWGGKHGEEKYELGMPRYQCRFSPAGFTLALEQLLKNADCDLWLDTLVCAAKTDKDNRITAVEVENSSGRGQINADCFIDASGTAVLIRNAGGKTEFSENFQTPWFIEKAENNLSINHLDEKIHIHCLGALQRQNVVMENPCDGKAVSSFIRDSWEIIRQYYDKNYCSGKSDRFQHFPLHLAAMPQFRKICRIQGMETLSDNQSGCHFESSVGLYADWRKPGYIWETPYGTLLPQDVRGVLVGGRCISTAGDAWEVFRVIPAAAMTGEIAGTAAALSIK